MSQNITKDADGLITNPTDAEDYAYNIAHKLQLSYRAQVEIEAAINEIVNSGCHIQVAVSVIYCLIKTISDLDRYARNQDQTPGLAYND